VIEVRDVEHESEFFVQLSEEQCERRGVGAAGDGEHDWAGAKERMGARV